MQMMLGVLLVSIAMGQGSALGPHPAVYASKKFGLRMSYPRDWKVEIAGDKRPSWMPNAEKADISSCILFQVTRGGDSAPVIKVSRNTYFGVESLRTALDAKPDLWLDPTRQHSIPSVPAFSGEAYVSAGGVRMRMASMVTEMLFTIYVRDTSSDAEFFGQDGARYDVSFEMSEYGVNRGASATDLMKKDFGVYRTMLESIKFEAGK